MSLTQPHWNRSSRPPLGSRAILFASLLVGFSATLLLAGRHVALTRSSEPVEQHPCILATSETLEKIQSRLDHEPYHTLYSRLLNQCEVKHLPVSGLTDLSPAVLRAKANATVFLLTHDEKYAKAACSLLRNLRTPSRGGRWSNDLASDAIAMAITYDCLQSYLRETGNVILERKVRELVYELAIKLNNGRHAASFLDTDSQRVRELSAAGLCALVIGDYDPPADNPRPRDIYQRARTGLNSILHVQICRDGTWAEGPGAYFEAASGFLPFMIANHRLTSEMLLDEAGLQAMAWAVRLRLPNGLRPNIESSSYTPGLTFALSALMKDVPPFLAWDANTSDIKSQIPAGLVAEALCWYDDKADGNGVPDALPSQALEASGDMVFRSDWGPEAKYLLLRAERGRASERGGPLAQPDATSIMVAQGSEILALDTGYGGWKSLGETTIPQAHSLVVGGSFGFSMTNILAGSQKVTTEDLVLNPRISAMRVQRVCSSQVTERVVIFAENSDYIIFDRVSTSKPENFSWLLHCNAGGKTGGSLQAVSNTARITRPTATMQVVLTHSGKIQPELERSPGSHFPQEGLRATHEVLTTTVPQTRRAGFLSVLSPRPTGVAAPHVNTQQNKDWLSVQLDKNRFGIFRVAGTAKLQQDALATDGYGMWWVADASGQPRYVLVLGAKWLEIQGKTVWQADEPTSAIWQATRPASF